MKTLFRACILSAVIAVIFLMSGPIAYGLAPMPVRTANVPYVTAQETGLLPITVQSRIDDDA